MKAKLFSSVLVACILILGLPCKTNAQWTQQSSGTTKDLLSVYFIDANVGYTVGNSGTILKTTDGGQNWVSQTSGITDNLTSVYICNLEVGYAVGNSGVILKTINGGETWEVQSSGTSNRLSCILFTDINTGYVVGNSGTFLKTIDGGQNWISSRFTSNDLYEIKLLNSGIGLVVGYNNAIFKTIDGGINWQSLNSGVTTGSWSSIHIFDDYTYYVSGGWVNVLIKSLDGGLTWSIIENVGGLGSKGMFFLDKNTGYVLSTYGINKTTNANTFFNAANGLVGATSPFNSIFFSDALNGWLVTNYGRIFRTSTGAESCGPTPSLPVGPINVCQGTETSQYSTLNTNAKVYSWELSPEAAGIISGTSNSGLVTWNNNYSGSASITVKVQYDNCADDTTFIESYPLIVNIKSTSPGAFGLALPANGSYLNTTPTFSWESSAGATHYQLYIDDVLRKDSIPINNCKILASEPLNAGMHTWYVIAHNGCTRESSDTRSFRVDATPPADFDLVSPAHNTWTNELKPELTWNASTDANSGLAKYQLWIDDVLNKDNISASETTVKPTGNLSNGLHAWEIKAIDVAGNIKASKQKNAVKIDTYPPGTLDHSSTLNDNCRYHVENINNHFNPQNMLTLECWVKPSQIPNSSYSTMVTLASYEGNEDYGLYFSNSGNEIQFYLNGVDYVNYTSKFSEFNKWTHFAGTYDGNKIRLYIDGILVSEKQVGKKLIKRNARTNIMIGYDSSYGVRYKFYGEIDEVRIWNYARSQYEINACMNTTIEKENLGLLGYWRFDKYQYNNADQNYYVPDETNDLNKMICTNVPILKEKTTNILGVSTTLLEPRNYEYINSTTPTFKWNRATDIGIGIEGYHLNIDHGTNIYTVSDTCITISNPLSYGLHSWYIESSDSLKNKQPSSTRIFFIDNAPPNPFNLTAPSDNQIVDLPTPNLTWQVTTDSIDGSGLSKYQLWINNMVNRDSIPVSQTTVSPNKALPQGAYTWFIKAYDKIGNVRQSTQTNTFYVDWDAPDDFNLIFPIDNAILTMSTPLFKWESSQDQGSGVRKYELHISGYDPVIVQATDTFITVPFSLPNNTYTWFVKAFDGSGAFTSSNAHTLKIELPVPEKPLKPSGIVDLCYNPANSAYTILRANFAESYLWEIKPSNAGSITGSDTIAVVNWTDDFTGNATISVKGYNNQGYGLPSEELSVVIHPLPGNAPLPDGATSVCQNSSETTYTVAAIVNADSYIWNISPSEAGVISGNGTTANVIWNSAFSGAAQIYVQGLNDCGEGLRSNPLQVDVRALPSKATSPEGKVSVCQGERVVVYTTTGAEHALTYTWKTIPESAAAISLDVTGRNATLNWNDTFSGETDVIVQGHNSCGNGEESALKVTVYSKPETPLISLNENILSSSASTGNQWYDLNGIIEGATEAELMVTADGEYYVIVTTSGCHSEPSDTIKVDYATGIGQLNLGNILIYPNPVLNNLFIRIDDKDTKKSVEIINVFGVKVYSGVINSREMTIPMGSFIPGIYLIKVDNKESATFFRIIKK
jgi:photosystem II stability/assembly factor-like uncharacterized protein